MRFAAILLLASACASTSSTDKPSFLFVQHSDRAILRGGKLMLQGVGENVVYDVEVLDGPQSAEGGPAALFIDNLAPWPVVRNGMHTVSGIGERRGSHINR